MNIIIILAILLFIGGIILMVGVTPPKKRTESDFVNSLVRYVKGTHVPIEGSEGSYRIDFVFEGVEFTFEKSEVKGFKENVYSILLKSKTINNFDLIFTEKGQVKTIDPSKGILGANTVSGAGEARKQVQVPKELSSFHVDTNKAHLVNELFQNKKIVQIFTKYITVDYRGYHLLTLNIKDGSLILEFDTQGTRKPSFHSLKNNVSILEYYIDDMVDIINMLKRLG